MGPTAPVLSAPQWLTVLGRYGEIIVSVFALGEEAVHRAILLGFATESRKVMLIAANPALPLTEVQA